jgi:hypothetical protein
MHGCMDIIVFDTPACTSASHDNCQVPSALLASQPMQAHAGPCMLPGASGPRDAGAARKVPHSCCCLHDLLMLLLLDGLAAGLNAKGPAEASVEREGATWSGNRWDRTFGGPRALNSRFLGISKNLTHLRPGRLHGAR